MILPRQFWDKYRECTVYVRISVAAGELVGAVLEAIKALVSKAAVKQAAPNEDDQAASVKSSVFDLSVKRLWFPDDLDVPDSLREATAGGMRVVKEPRDEGEAVTVALALAVPKFVFKEELQEDFVETVRKACGGRAVKIDDVAAKPFDFRGGGPSPPPPLPSNWYLFCRFVGPSDSPRSRAAPSTYT